MPEAPHPRYSITAVAALCVALFGFAFIAAPRSCAWGLSAYFWSGVALTIAGAALPSIVDDKQLPRAGISLLLGGTVVAVWVIGLLAAPFQLLCRLF